ncbi:hypothetical protein EI94DRAFT_1702398 [Lactarius quietus]|nr:hypothetical protein EI94DRAFT_1702398 [Lactarius quietus]
MIERKQAAFGSASGKRAEFHGDNASEREHAPKAEQLVGRRELVVPSGGSWRFPQVRWKKMLLLGTKLARGIEPVASVRLTIGLQSEREKEPPSFSSRWSNRLYDDLCKGLALITSAAHRHEAVAELGDVRDLHLLRMMESTRRVTRSMEGIMLDITYDGQGLSLTLASSSSGRSVGGSLELRLCDRPIATNDEQFPFSAAAGLSLRRRPFLQWFAGIPCYTVFPQVYITSIPDLLAKPPTGKPPEGLETTTQGQAVLEGSDTEDVETSANSIPTKDVSVPPTSVAERLSRPLPEPEAATIPQSSPEGMLSSTSNFPPSFATSLQTRTGRFSS